MDTGLSSVGDLVSLREGQSTDRWPVCPVVGEGVTRWHFYPRAEPVFNVILSPQEEGNSWYLLVLLQFSHRNMHGVTSLRLKIQEMLRRMT